MVDREYIFWTIYSLGWLLLCAICNAVYVILRCAGFSNPQIWLMVKRAMRQALLDWK